MSKTLGLIPSTKNQKQNTKTKNNSNKNIWRAQKKGRVGEQGKESVLGLTLVALSKTGVLAALPFSHWLSLPYVGPTLSTASEIKGGPSL
jgi:hypothetical protein